MRLYVSRFVVIGIAAYVATTLGTFSDASAQDALSNTLKGEIKALRSGPLLIHGNFCGIGSRPGGTPIDALDEACMRHDACTKTGKLPSCACDDRLRSEATEIANDPRAPTEEKTVAAATATAMAVLICKIAPPVPAGISPPTPAAPPPPAETR